VRRVLAPLLVLLVLIGPLPAGAAPEDLLGQAATLLEQVRDATAAKRAELLERAQGLLARIERDHPESEVARALRRGEAVGGVDPDAIDRALARARTVPALAIACAEVADHACLLANAEVLIDEHELGERWPALGREYARVGELAAAARIAARLDRSGELLDASEVVSAIARRLVADGARDAARRRVADRIQVLERIEDAARRTHRLVAFGINLLDDGVGDLADLAFAAGRDVAQRAIDAVPPSAAAEAVLVIYEAQALAALGQSEDAIERLAGLEDGPVEAGWHALAQVVARIGEVAAVETIEARAGLADDWRINSALVEADARAGRYQAAVDRATETSELVSTRWLRFRIIASAMADRGDAAPAAKVLAVLEQGAAPQQLLDLAGLWREIGRPEDAARLRSRIVDDLRDEAGARLEQPVATAEEADAIAGWTLALARTIDPS
jgi:tetratricopeptide (TPR) repeat protein